MNHGGDIDLLSSDVSIELLENIKEENDVDLLGLSNHLLEDIKEEPDVMEPICGQGTSVPEKKFQNTFRVDKSKIQVVPHAARNSELNDLNIDVFNQDEFEQGVLSQVDEAVAAEERERSCNLLEKELDAINTDIKSCENELCHMDKVLSLIGKEGLEQRELKNRLASVQSQQRNKSNQLKTLNTRKKFLSQKLNDLKDEVESGPSGQQTSLSRALGLSNEENESERLVRLGEMTPFGTVVNPAKSAPAGRKRVEVTDFESFLLSKDQKISKFSKQKGAHSNQNLKHKQPVQPVKQEKTNIFDAQLTNRLQKRNQDLISTRPSSGMKKPVKKPKLRHNFSNDPDLSDWDSNHEDESHSGSDDSWMPDEGDEDNQDIKDDLRDEKLASKRKRLKQDGEFTGCSPKKKRKLSQEKIHRDDGDEKSYEKRLKKYHKDEVNKQKHKMTEDSESGGSDAEFDGGFKVPSQLWKKLYRYQKTGVRWLWELHTQQTGGILGDEMGLGKTIQIICFLAGLRHSRLTDASISSRYVGLGPTLIICPATVMHQWVKEMHTWWPVARVAVMHSSGSSNSSPERLIQTIARNRGVLVTSFSTLLRSHNYLLRFDWHYVILDEGHKIRNPDAQITLACKQFRTCHRLILSGSPMQNNLKELWSLFDFVYPGKLGTLPDFMQQFSVPIVQGGYANATNIQVQTAYKCALTLRDTIAPYLLRRMKSDVQANIQLPNKNEQVLFCRLTDHQRDVYREYLDSKECRMILDGKFMAFPGLITLRKVCNHPDLSTGGPKLFGMQDEDTSNCEESDEFGYWSRSGKMIVVEALLKLWKKQEHKVLLFTQSRQMLNILEQFVQSRDYSYLRMDGGTSIPSRQPLVQQFNTNPTIFIFLLTTRVGGLGINLTGADRVILYDPDWNPSTDTQARERAWRIGQLRNVTIYRLLTTGTIEEKIYHRQIFKQFLTNRVLKDPKQRRFFKSNDLHELFTLGDDDPNNGTETSAIFAGTGSDIKLKKSRSKHRKRENRFDKLKENETKLGLKSNGDDEDSDDERVAKMRQHAKEISMKMSQKWKTSVSSTDEKCSHTGEELEGNSEVIADSAQQRTVVADASESSERKDEKKSLRKEKKKKSSRKSKHTKTAAATAVEGEEIAYLDRLSVYKPENEEGADEEGHARQDDYVLKKLLKKSGVHSAMLHDNIMMSADSDYLLVESEANKVAKQAALALKQSRLRCQQNTLPGLPTWTGRNGVAGSPSLAARPRFGLKKNPSLPIASNNSSSATCRKESSFSISTSKEVDAKKFDGSALVNKTLNKNMMSSAELLARLRSSNAVETNQNPESSNLPSQAVGIPPEHVDLITDIRNFLSTGSSVDGQATTNELLSQFKSRVPPEQSSVFKAMLNQVCNFDRNSGVGIWQLKPEFR